MSVTQTAVLQTDTVYIMSTVFKSGCDIPSTLQTFPKYLGNLFMPGKQTNYATDKPRDDFVNAKSHAREKPLLCLEKSQKSQFVLRNGRNRMPKKPKNIFRIFENSIRPSFRTNIYRNQYPLSAPDTVLQSLSYNVKRVDCLYLPSSNLPPKSPTTHISPPAPRQLQTHQKQNILPIISLLQMY